MKIRNLALSAILIAAVGAASSAQAADQLAAGNVAARAQVDPYQATVTKIVKLVEWQRYRTTRWQKASLENLLLVGDTIRTGADAKTELQYGDGSVTRVGSLTSLTLTGDGKRELRLDSGKVWLHIQKGGAGMRVITPGAVAAVTGTELLVEFDPVKQLTEVTVFEGSVNVISDVGNLVRVLGGTTTMVPHNAPAAAPVPLGTGKLEVRENIFKPLSVKDGGEAQPTQPTGEKDPTTGTEPAETDPTAVKPDTTGTTPTTPTGANPKPETGTATQPTTGEPAGTAPTGPTPADKPATAPDLKNQNDPRFMGGSPTTGTIRVIIE
jgi:hypothetical protein